MRSRPPSRGSNRTSLASGLQSVFFSKYIPITNWLFCLFNYYVSFVVCVCQCMCVCVSVREGGFLCLEPLCMCVNAVSDRLHRLFFLSHPYSASPAHISSWTNEPAPRPTSSNVLCGTRIDLTGFARVHLQLVNSKRIHMNPLKTHYTTRGTGLCWQLNAVAWCFCEWLADKLQTRIVKGKPLHWLCTLIAYRFPRAVASIWCELESLHLCERVFCVLYVV